MTADLDDQHIFNMDETPVYIDMISSTTLDFTGEKNVNGASTGHEKSRLTVAISTVASGKMLKGYVFFKGLKNIPKCNVPANTVMNVSIGGSMKEELMLDWCQKVFRARGSFLYNEDSLLLLDTHASHTRPSVKEELDKMNVKIKFAPAKQQAICSL